VDDLLVQGGIIGGRREDLAVADGRIRRIGPDLAVPARATIDATGKLVLPAFVEAHIHPDKAYVADRTAGLRAAGPTPQALVAELKR
jgi:cytosine/adenosine deaminase-related metal-dependent hydrolase